VAECIGQLATGDGEAGRSGVAERLVVPEMPGNAGGGKGPQFRTTREAGRDRRLGNLSTPESVQRLRTALHAKAKDEPGFRFYALYDKIYRLDVLKHAYDCCRAYPDCSGTACRALKPPSKNPSESCAVNA
jgi:hypothetical protein